MKLNPFKNANLTDVQVYLSEEIQRFWEEQKENFRIKIKKLREKGRERLTVMLIPHSEKKILNFHITFFAITSWIAVIVLVILIASVTIINHSSTVKEVDILLGNEKDSKKLIADFKKETKLLGKIFDTFKPEIIGLHRITSGNSGANNLFGGIGGPATGKKHEKPEHDPSSQENLPSEIYDINRIQVDLAVAAKTIDGVKNFLVSRKKIIENTPSVWPTDGYIGNLFGRVEAGTDQEYQHGVDIIAMPGAAVRATAPGTVVFSGWDDALGLTVLIKHKYGYMTTYGHNQRVNVREGQKVSKNEVIAYVGRTGSSQRFACHYRVKVGTVFVDPLPYLNRIKLN